MYAYLIDPKPDIGTKSRFRSDCFQKGVQVLPYREGFSINADSIQRMEFTPCVRSSFKRWRFQVIEVLEDCMDVVFISGTRYKLKQSDLTTLQVRGKCLKSLIGSACSIAYVAGIAEVLELDVEEVALGCVSSAAWLVRAAPRSSVEDIERQWNTLRRTKKRQ
jgi:hypothetical protein